jgi:hypothetical protein
LSVGLQRSLLKTALGVLDGTVLSTLLTGLQVAELLWWLR